MLGGLKAHHIQLAGHHLYGHGPPGILDHPTYYQGGSHHQSEGPFFPVSVQFGAVGLFVGCLQYPQTQEGVLVAESWHLQVGLDLMWPLSPPWGCNCRLWVIHTSHWSCASHLSSPISAMGWGRFSWL